MRGEGVLVCMRREACERESGLRVRIGVMQGGWGVEEEVKKVKSGARENIWKDDVKGKGKDRKERMGNKVG